MWTDFLSHELQARYHLFWSRRKPDTLQLPHKHIGLRDIFIYLFIFDFAFKYVYTNFARGTFSICVRFWLCSCYKMPTTCTDLKEVEKIYTTQTYSAQVINSHIKVRRKSLLVWSPPLELEMFTCTVCVCGHARALERISLKDMLEWALTWSRGLLAARAGQLLIAACKVNEACATSRSR